MDLPNIKHVLLSEGEVLFGPRTALHRDTKFMSTFFFALRANTDFLLSALAFLSKAIKSSRVAAFSNQSPAGEEHKFMLS